MKIETFGAKEVQTYKGSPRENHDALAWRPMRPVPAGLSAVKG